MASHPPSPSPVAVVGAGSWGTALAQALARAGRQVLLWGRDHGRIAEIRERGENARYLPGIPLDPRIRATAAAKELEEAELALLAVPAQTLRSVVQTLSGAMPETVVICAKGLERESGKRLSAVVAEEHSGVRIAVLSGPSFAAEVAAGKPTALTLAAGRLEEAQALARALASPALRLYPSDDVVGVEIAAALKNVVAIAAGVVMGRELGENARAALITRGLAEMARLAVRLGGRAETLSGLAGLGDLLLTATSLTSRNTRFGFALGRAGRSAALAQEELAEGRWSAGAAVRLARTLEVDMPIAEAVARVVEGSWPVEVAIRRLLERPVAERE